MDLPSLMQACLDGLASGSLSAFGSALGAATIALFRKLAGRKGDMDENELKAMSSWADPYKLAAKAAELAKGDPDFNQLLSSWCDLMEKHLGSSHTRRPPRTPPRVFSSRAPLSKRTS